MNHPRLSLRSGSLAALIAVFALASDCGPDAEVDVGYDEDALAGDDDDPGARSMSATTRSGLTLTVKPAEVSLGKRRAKTFKVTVTRRNGTPVVGQEVLHYYECISDNSAERPCSVTPAAHSPTEMARPPSGSIPRDEPAGNGAVISTSRTMNHSNGCLRVFLAMILIGRAAILRARIDTPSDS